MVEAEQQGGAPFTEGHVEADRFRIRYVEAGQGNPVVMLHGPGGLILSKVHDELAKRYRVIAFEMPGFGQSSPNTRSQSAKDLARTTHMRWLAHRSGAGWRCGRRSSRRSRWTFWC